MKQMFVFLWFRLLLLGFAYCYLSNIVAFSVVIWIYYNLWTKSLNQLKPKIWKAYVCYISRIGCFFLILINSDLLDWFIEETGRIYPSAVSFQADIHGIYSSLPMNKKFLGFSTDIFTFIVTGFACNIDILVLLCPTFHLMASLQIFSNNVNLC